MIRMFGCPKWPKPSAGSQEALHPKKHGSEGWLSKWWAGHFSGFILYKTSGHSQSWEVQNFGTAALSPNNPSIPPTSGPSKSLEQTWEVLSRSGNLQVLFLTSPCFLDFLVITFPMFDGKKCASLCGHHS